MGQGSGRRRLQQVGKQVAQAPAFSALALAAADLGALMADPSTQ